jgi:hypothetical protein
MTAREWLLDELRPGAFALAYRMLGSVSDARAGPRPVAAAWSSTRPSSLNDHRLKITHQHTRFEIRSYDLVHG